MGYACRGGGGGGNITTTHEHYTDFEIDGVAFRCYGDLVFKDGDKVKLYAIKSSRGYYQVEWVRNITRDFYIGVTPSFDDTKRIDIVEIIKSTLVLAMCGAFFGIFIGLFVGFIAWGFYDAQFWKSFKITWFITVIVAALLFPIKVIIFLYKPESEESKREIQTIREMYQKIMSDDE